MINITSRFFMVSRQVAIATCLASYISLSYGQTECSQQWDWVQAWASAASDDSAIFLPIRPLTMRTGLNQTHRILFSPLGKTMADNSGKPKIRLKLSNRFSKSDLKIDAATLGQSESDNQGRGTASIFRNSLQTLTFNNGERSVIIKAGQEIYTDPIAFELKTLENYALSIDVKSNQFTQLLTKHLVARQTSYATRPSVFSKENHAYDLGGSAFTQDIRSRVVLTGVDIWAPKKTTSSIVTLGDSITDGYEGQDIFDIPVGFPENTETIGLNKRYPDFLKQRLDTFGLSDKFFVSNAGITSNRVLTESALSGSPAMNRYKWDALGASGVNNVILFIGINDIANTLKDYSSAEDFINAMQSAYTNIITDLQSHGVRVIQATLTPAGGSFKHGTPDVEEVRQRINTWIREKSLAEVKVDFDKAVRDPANPTELFPAYAADDKLHLNAAGYQKLAETIDLGTLKHPACN